jgi:UDP-3-O-[3-hydroxymyristoyl] N-acetylglucosamine deacetylase
MYSQRTIGRSVCTEGIGIHTGRIVRATFKPACEGSGINFVRTDLGGKTVPALYPFVSSTRRGTTLERDGAGVATVEHLLAALSILGIDNLTIELDGPEVPILDGSALPFIELLRKASMHNLNAMRRVIRLKEPLWLTWEDTAMCAFPADKYSLEVMVNFPYIGPQRVAVDYDDPTLAEQVASARTFGFREEVEELLRQGLALGGSLDNALVFGPEGCSAPLRFEDEPARHKLLDMIGDLALLGGVPLAMFIGIKSGHFQHLELAAAMMKRSEFVA